MNKKEVVGIQLANDKIYMTNKALVELGLNGGKYKKLITRQLAEALAACDLGINWERLAKSETLFWIDDEERVHWTNDDEIENDKIRGNENGI